MPAIAWQGGAVSSAETDGPTGPGDDGPVLTLVLLGVGVLGVSLAAPIGAATAAAGLAVAFWRTAMASAAGVPWTFARPRPRAEVTGVAGRKALRHSVTAGLWLALHFALWMPSLRLTSVAAATALVCTTPVWTLAWGRLTGRAVPRPVLVGVALALTGVVVITGVDASGDRDALLGDAMALAGGMAAAGYVLEGDRAREHVSTATYTAVAYPVCAVVLLVVCLFTGTELGGYAARTWVELVVLTLAAQLLGHSVLNRTLRTAGATTVSLAILLEVPGAALVAWLWLGQTPPVAVLPGAALVMAGLAVVVLAGARARQRAASRPAAVPSRRTAQ